MYVEHTMVTGVTQWRQHVWEYGLVKINQCSTKRTNNQKKNNKKGILNQINETISESVCWNICIDEVWKDFSPLIFLISIFQLNKFYQTIFFVHAINKTKTGVSIWKQKSNNIKTLLLVIVLVLNRRMPIFG